MPAPHFNSPALPMGQIALHAAVCPSLPLPGVRSYLVAGVRRTHHETAFTEEYYPSRYALDGTLLGHLRFALRHEAVDMGILHSTLIAVGEEALTDWARTEPTGAYSRRSWFFYEMLTGRTLDLPPVQTGNYVDALNPRLHFTAAPLNSPRHRVRNNLLGASELCPTVRRTRKLEAMIALGLDQEARRLTEQVSPETLWRAVSFLYTKETRSSFAIEGEVPSRTREERFLHALRRLSAFDPSDKAALIALQGSIVEPRYAAQEYRNFQNFVGETTRRYRRIRAFYLPAPRGRAHADGGLDGSDPTGSEAPLDPVIAAAVSAFAFVFIHPFEDGNGRLHRFLIQYALNRRGFTPPGIVFPVSAAILRQRPLYESALEVFSKPALAATDWDFNADHGIVVRNETRDLYRFFDATVQAEYLYDRIAETIREDFKEELEFLAVFDAAFEAVRNIVEMPDRRAALLVRLCLQNGGSLSQNKRKQFPELTEAEIGAMEQALSALLLAAHSK